MISELQSLDLDQLNARIRQINTELKRIEGQQNLMILPKEQPQNAATGQMWWASGKIYVMNDGTVETYSKD